MRLNKISRDQHFWVKVNSKKSLVDSKYNVSYKFVKQSTTRNVPNFNSPRTVLSPRKPESQGPLCKKLLKSIEKVDRLEGKVVNQIIKNIEADFETASATK